MTALAYIPYFFAIVFVFCDVVVSICLETKDARLFRGCERERTSHVLIVTCTIFVRLSISCCFSDDVED